MALLRIKKLILALIHELPKMVNLAEDDTKDKMLIELQNLYRKLDLYNFIITKLMRKDII